MCRIKVSVSLELVFFAIVLVASIAFTPPLHAQADVDATIAVRMIDAVDSTSDPAGKRYRASVTRTVDAANGVVIASGSAAVVTLANSGSGWSAQLSSVSINGQPVAVASGSATVASAAQGALVNATNAMNSVLGGFGHHVKIPAAVSAVATGQRVLLPPGTTLTFVLSQPPAAAAAPSMTAAAAPTPGPAASPASSANPAPNAAPGPAAAGRNDWYVFCSTGHYAYTNASEPMTYFSEVFPEPKIGLHVTFDWNEFLFRQKKSLPQGVCNDALGLSAAQAMKKQKKDEFRKEGKQVVETGWKFDPSGGSIPGQAAAPAPAQAQAGAPPAAPATAATGYYAQCAAIFGERANEHCAAAANEYYVYCSGSVDSNSSVFYFSDVFAFNKNVSGSLSADLAPSFLLFLETKYGVKVSNDFYPTSRYTGGSYPTHCSQSYTPLSWAQHEKQSAIDNATKSLHKQIVETGWKTSIAPLPPVTAPPAAANEYYVSCYSDTALSVQYFSEIFAAARTVEPIRNAFFAFLQKKYGFNDPRPGPPVDCDVSAKPANAYMFQTAWSVRQHREGLADLNKKQVVKSGWKYAP